MMPHEDIHFELVDLPPLSPEHPIPWIASTFQTADACLLVVDLAEPSCVEQVEAVHAVLREKRVTLTERWPAAEDFGSGADEGDDPFALRLPTLMLANKADRIADVGAELDALRELANVRYPALAVSAETGHGLADIGPWLFSRLGVVRVYSKAPGHPPDRQRPFTLRHGGTVEHVARLVHQDIAQSLKYARVWGKSGFGGQQVGREHPLADGDVVELHT
jgi:ribosome-interacting GTPase 1